MLKLAGRLKELLGTRNAVIAAAPLVEDEYAVGRGTYGAPMVHEWGEGARLAIGNFCSIADGVQIFLGGEHRVDWVTTYPFNKLWASASAFEGHPATKGDVEIGHDVWIGSGTLILSGVKIGNGAVVGARSVVTKEVLPYEIVAGNPARHVRYRFDDETIAALLDIAWWEWEDEQILEALPQLLSADLKSFVLNYSSSHHFLETRGERS